jgi:hypothetical protein
MVTETASVPRAVIGSLEETTGWAAAFSELTDALLLLAVPTDAWLGALPKSSADAFIETRYCAEFEQLTETEEAALAALPV